MTHSVDVHYPRNDRDRYFSGNVTQISFGAENDAWHPDGQNGYANPDGTAVNLEQAHGRVVEYVLPRAAVTVLRGVVRQCLVEPRHFYVSGYLMGSTMRLSGSGLLRYSQARAELSTKALTSSAEVTGVV